MTFYIFMSMTILFTYHHLFLFCIQFDMAWFIQIALYNFGIFGQFREEWQSPKCETLGLVTRALGSELHTCALTLTIHECHSNISTHSLISGNHKNYLVLWLNKAWGYFKLKCFLPLYFLFETYINNITCWWRVIRIIFSTFIEENISKVMTNAYDLWNVMESTI